MSAAWKESIPTLHGKHPSHPTDRPWQSLCQNNESYAQVPRAFSRLSSTCTVNYSKFPLPLYLRPRRDPVPPLTSTKAPERLCPDPLSRTRPHPCPYHRLRPLSRPLPCTDPSSVPGPVRALTHKLALALFLLRPKAQTSDRPVPVVTFGSGPEPEPIPALTQVQAPVPSLL